MSRPGEVCDAACEVTPLHLQSVAAARAGLPDPDCVERATALLKAVADPTRFRLLSALQGRELCVCDLAAVLGLSESATSHQLRVLREHRLVAVRREGRVAHYRLLDGHVTQLLDNALEHAREDVEG